MDSWKRHRSSSGELIETAPGSVRVTKASFRANSGGYYWSAQGTAAVGVAGTYVKVSTASSTTSARAENFTISTDNRATYTGTTTQTFKVIYTLTTSTAANNELVGLKIAKNGTVLDATLVNRFVATATDEGAVTVQGFIELAENDYVELWATNEDGTDNVYIEHGYCTITEA